MQVLEKVKNLRSHPALKTFPKGHFIAASALCVLFFVGALIPSEEATASRKFIEIEIPVLSEEAQGHDVDILPSLSQAAIEAPQTTLNITTQTIKSGDNLSAVFKRAGLNDNIMINLLNSCKECKSFSKLYPGHKFEFSLNDSNQLVGLRYIKDRLNEIKYEKNAESYSFEKVSRQPDIKSAYRHGIIEANLFDSAKDAKLNDKLAMELANIFGWDIDFALDLRKGDRFKVIFEEHFLNGEKLKTGNILAAEFINQGEVFRALRYKNSDGDYSYYTPEGTSMRKAFLRAPLDFRRISGNFNPRRVHPIFKTIRPHRGTDYAADRGTPVWSPGTGRVITSGYTKANGNYVVIQHGNNIQTKYLHLHKRYVKKGQKVKQKQKIGTVGSTGYSTGPHLHYEFLIAGVHRNPRTVINKLPKASAIKKSELPAFKAQTKQWLAELIQTANETQIASAKTKRTTL